jgi:hypothetical protein
MKLGRTRAFCPGFLGGGKLQKDETTKRGMKERRSQKWKQRERGEREKEQEKEKEKRRRKRRRREQTRRIQSCISETKRKTQTEEGEKKEARGKSG